MNIGIDIGALLNTRINDALLEMSEDSEPTRILVEFANNHGYFGTDAIGFITELVMMLEKASEAVKEEKRKDEEE